MLLKGEDTINRLALQADRANSVTNRAMVASL